MTDSQLIASTIIGVFAPWLIAVIQRRDWSTELRYIAALLTYLALSAFVQLFTEGFDTTDWGWRDYFKVAAIMVITGQSAFQLVWRKTVAPVIENKTSPGAP